MAVECLRSKSILEFREGGRQESAGLSDGQQLEHRKRRWFFEKLF